MVGEKGHLMCFTSKSGVVLLLGPWDFCFGLKIKLCFSSPVHPQANNQVETVNKFLKSTLKKKLEARKGAWSELLLEVLWAYRCIERMSTGETPYSLAFGIKAVIPVEVGVPTNQSTDIHPRWMWSSSLLAWTYWKSIDSALLSISPRISHERLSTTTNISVIVTSNQGT